MFFIPMVCLLTYFTFKFMVTLGTTFSAKWDKDPTNPTKLEYQRTTWLCMVSSGSRTGSSGVGEVVSASCCVVEVVTGCDEILAGCGVAEVAAACCWVDEAVSELLFGCGVDEAVS